MICAECGFNRQVGGFKASLVRNGDGAVIGFKNGWICTVCALGYPPISERVLNRWTEATPLQEEELPVIVKPKKIKVDILKLKEELKEFDEGAKDAVRKETHKAFKLFLEKYFNE